MEEIWKPVVGWELLYHVSNHGRVKGLEKKSGFLLLNEKLLKISFLKNGYARISMYNNGFSKLGLIHRLVAQAFIPNPENKPQVNHINGIKSDNRVENLEWNTRSENIVHAFSNGYYENNSFKINHPYKGKFGVENKSSKKVNQYTIEGEFIKTWGSISDIERDLGISNSNISAVCRGKRKTIGGFIWKHF